MLANLTTGAFALLKRVNYSYFVLEKNWWERKKSGVNSVIKSVVIRFVTVLCVKKEVKNSS